MSDDLISRKAFMEYLGLEDTEENREENVGEIVTLEDFNRQATAFDKEKVIEELKEMATHSASCKNQCEFGSTEYFNYMGAEAAYKTTIEIVEKGGIE